MRVNVTVCFSTNHRGASLMRKFASKPAKPFIQRMDQKNDSNIVDSSISGKTLLSVKECIQAYDNNKSNSNAFDSTNVVFIDATWWHKGHDADAGRKAFESGPRIPNSRYVDIDDLCLSPNLNTKDLPHMLPSPQFFASAMNYLNISNNDHIIITARDKSVYFTPRVWFLFKTFGHDASKLHLMQGSLEQWMSNGGEINKDPVTVPVLQTILSNVEKACESEGSTLQEESGYIAKNPMNVCDMNHVTCVLDGNERKKNDDMTLILDSRGSSFKAKGHMPNAIHLPYSEWLQADNAQVWKDVKDLKKIFLEVGVDPMTKQNIVCSCGTGVSVCHTLLALELCGRNLSDSESTTVMYDGSWAEWSKNPKNKKVF